MEPREVRKAVRFERLCCQEQHSACQCAHPPTYALLATLYVCVCVLVRVCGKVCRARRSVWSTWVRGRKVGARLWQCVEFPECERA